MLPHMAKRQSPRRKGAKLALSAIALGLGVGLAFGAWAATGTEVFGALIQTGLSWCM